ncbi:MAG: DMT family transporter [Actinomycetota bacterium]|nr:DMT family transporter [Actinomycetota bacterium]
MAAVLALLSSLAWGTSDFLGGLAARRVGSIRVLAVSYPAGAVLITFLALVIIPGQWSWSTVTIGIVAGVVGALAIGLLYAALSRGQMGIVSPITAVLSGAVPVGVGVVLGESLPILALVGVAVAGVAVVLVSRESGPHRRTPIRAVVLAAASGLAIGVYLSVIGTAPDDSGIWVATMGRWFSTIVVVAILAILIYRSRSAPPANRPSFPWNLAIAAGVLDALANAVFQLAAQRGLLAIVAVIGSLYPAATVILARVFLKETLSRTQVLGVTLALLAAATLTLA